MSAKTKMPFKHFHPPPLLRPKAGNLDWFFLRISLFEKLYTMRALLEWCIVLNNTSTSERYFHISRVLSGVSRLHNDPEFRNNTYSVPV